ncbi:MAG: response regulator [Dethiobacteria bacterium]|jgi:DNA-binding NarL/FixJ family response regulator
MKRSILIVDQDDRFTVGLREELKKRRCRIFIACDRCKAQQIIESRTLQLIVLGALTPRGDAFKLHQWIRSRPVTGSLPMIVVDLPCDEKKGYGWRRDEGIRLDAEEYFCRPLDLSQLVAAIETQLVHSSRKIRVLVVDDHALVREGIRALLDLQRDMLIVGEAADGWEALEKTDQLLPHVVIMDIMMPQLDGIEALKLIKDRYKDVRVLILSQHDDEDHIGSSWEAGAFGFIPKKSVSTELLKAIRTARRSRQRLRHYSPGC